MTALAFFMDDPPLQRDLLAEASEQLLADRDLADAHEAMAKASATVAAHRAAGCGYTWEWMPPQPADILTRNRKPQRRRS